MIRAGYKAIDSPYKTHHKFNEFVILNVERFKQLLDNGERCCGEWLEQAHGTIYDLKHEPFVIFDIFDNEDNRITSGELKIRCDSLKFITPHEIHRGNSISINEVLKKLGKHGFHGAVDEVEGAVWRLERNQTVEFLAKYVKPNKVDGKYLDERILNKTKQSL